MLKTLLAVLALFIYAESSAIAQGYLNPPIYATGYVWVQPGGTVATQIRNAVNPNNLNIYAGGNITTWNISMPFPAFDGEIISVGCPGGNVGAISITAPTPTTVASGGATSCTQNSGIVAQYQYNFGLNTWLNIIPASQNINNIAGLGTGVAALLGGSASGTGGPLGSASPAITGVLSSQNSFSGTLPSTTLGYLPLSESIYIPSDNGSQSGFTPGQTIPVALGVQELCCGSAVNNGRNAGNFFFAMETPSSPSNAYKFYVGLHSYMSTFVSDNGACCSTIAGVFEAVTGESWLNDTSATSGAPAYFGAVIGAEFVAAASAYNIAQIKANLVTTEWGQDRQHGAQVDSHIWSAANAGAIGLNTWAQIDGLGGGAPLNSSATLIKVINSTPFETIATGIDFTSMTITGNVLQWDTGAYVLEGNGNAVLNGLLLDSGLTVGNTAGTIVMPNIPTGETPVGSVCIDAGGNLFKKTTTGSCV